MIEQRTTLVLVVLGVNLLFLGGLDFIYVYYQNDYASEKQGPIGNISNKVYKNHISNHNRKMFLFFYEISYLKNLELHG